MYLSLNKFILHDRNRLSLHTVLYVELKFTNLVRQFNLVSPKSYNLVSDHACHILIMCPSNFFITRIFIVLDIILFSYDESC